MTGREALNEAAAAVGGELQTAWGRDGLECRVGDTGLWPFVGYKDTVATYNEAQQRAHTLRVYPDEEDGKKFQPLNGELRTKWPAWDKLCEEAEKAACELSGEAVWVLDAQLLRISPQTAGGTVFKQHTDNHNAGCATARFSMDILLNETPDWAESLHMQLEEHPVLQLGRKPGDALLFRAMAPHKTLDTRPFRRVNQADVGKTLTLLGGRVRIGNEERVLGWGDEPWAPDGTWTIAAAEDKVRGRVRMRGGAVFANSDEWEHMKVTLFLGGAASDGALPPCTPRCACSWVAGSATCVCRNVGPG